MSEHVGRLPTISGGVTPETSGDRRPQSPALEVDMADTFAWWFCAMAMPPAVEGAKARAFPNVFRFLFSILFWFFKNCQVWWCTLLIPAYRGSGRLILYRFKDSLVNTAGPGQLGVHKETIFSKENRPEKTGLAA